METDIKNRVKVALRALDISPYSIARMQNLNERTIYDQINGNSKIGVATIEALLAYCPNLSAEWIFRGTGDMLKRQQADTIIIRNDASGDSVRTGNITGDHNVVSTHNGVAPAATTMQDDYKRLLAEKDKQITDLQKDKDNLMLLLTNLTAKR